MSAVHTHKWRKVRAQVLREEATCYLCGSALDFDAEPRSPRSPSVDHILSRHEGGDPYDRANLRAACYGCNSRKQHRQARPLSNLVA